MALSRAGLRLLLRKPCRQEGLYCNTALHRLGGSLLVLLVNLTELELVEGGRNARLLSTAAAVPSTQRPVCLPLPFWSSEWSRRCFSSEGTEEEQGKPAQCDTIDTPDFVKLVTNLQKGRCRIDTRLIDVREPEELIESGRIPGAINIPRKRP